ncbi:hypothetical protein Scep_004095 [Stephania cephalantha]|uniref:Integrase catalytic domain-containing protein n=1 Tax=Stephania cephalantha TaxID=152367 RepID=A0AAP0KRS9_9MAGN
MVFKSYDLSTRSMFEELDETQKIKVQLGNKKEMQVEGSGSVGVDTLQARVRVLDNVQFVPDLGYNLLSVGQLMASGYSIVFDDKACVITNKKSGKEVRIGMASNKMFPLDVSNIQSFALAAKVDDDSKLWHLRYGHLNVKGIKLLSDKGMVHGLPRINSIELCEGCVYGKQTRKSFPSGKAWRASKCLELIHADLCGPMQTKTFGGSRYFLLFTDDFSRMSWVYFVESKSETFERFQKFKALVEKQSGCHIKTLRTDRGGEFVSKEFNKFCEKNGIKRELITPYTPEQNGVVERKNRTVVEMARNMLTASGLSNEFWAEAVATSIYLLNISPTRAVMNQTPYEAWCGRRPSVSHLRVFGCISYALVNSQVRQKLDEKSEKCIFVGYCNQSKAYRLYNPLSGQIVIRRDVVFDENTCWKWSEDQVQHNILAPLAAEIFANEEHEPTLSSSATTPSTSTSTPSRNSSTTLEESSDETPPTRYRSLTDIYASCQFALTVSDPINYGDAAEKEEWRKAMEEEMKTIEKNETWEITDLP